MKQFKTPVDEKTEHLWGIQCYADMITGWKIHIFASRGQWGKPQRDYQGEMSKYIIVEKLNLIIQILILLVYKKLFCYKVKWWILVIWYNIKAAEITNYCSCRRENNGEIDDNGK